MGRIGLLGGAYKSQSVAADCQSCVNLMFERDESGMGKSDGIIVNTPGLNKVVTLADNNANGRYVHLFRTPPIGVGSVSAFERCFALEQDILWEISTSYVATPLFTTLATFTDLSGLSVAVGPTQFAFVFNGQVEVYNYSTGIPTHVGTINSEPISSVAYVAGYFLAAGSFSRNIYFSAINDATSWNPADVFQPSNIAMQNVWIINDHGELWIFGDTNTLVYYATGDPNTPFSPNPSGLIQQGLAARYSVQQLDNAPFWLGSSSQGPNVAFRANGYGVQRISTAAIEAEWNTYSTTADAIAWSYEDGGHTIYVLWFPTAGKTWCYDVLTGMWHQRTYLNPATGLEEAYLGMSHVYFNGVHLVGGRQIGTKDAQIYQMNMPVTIDPGDGTISYDFCDDAGDDIRRSRRMPYISRENERINIDCCEIDMETGLAPIPPLHSDIYMADPGLTGANVPGTKLPAGTYEVVLAINSIAADELIYLSGAVSITFGSPRELIVSPGVINDPASQYYRLYISNDGGLTWFSQDFPDSTITLIVMPTTSVSALPDDSLRYRGGLLTLSISKDRGHTFNPLSTRDCGQAGEYSVRPRWYRLGQARFWVFEISCTDPVPWRFTDCYVSGADLQRGTPRIVENLRKQA